MILPPVMGIETSIVVSFASRLWFAAVELLCAGIGLAILKWVPAKPRRCQTLVKAKAL